MNGVQIALAPVQRIKHESFPPLPNTGFPLINYYHDEALGCLENGLDQAAIMTTNVLLESSLKLMIVLHEICSGTTVEDALKQWNKTTLHSVIKGLLREGIVSSDLADAMQDYRTKIRNLYQHGSTPVGPLQYPTHDPEQHELGGLAGLIAGFAIVHMARARSDSFDCFTLVDDIVRNKIPWEEIRRYLPTVVIPTPQQKFSFGGSPTPEYLSTGRSIWGVAVDRDASRDIRVPDRK